MRIRVEYIGPVMRLNRMGNFILRCRATELEKRHKSGPGFKWKAEVHAVIGYLISLIRNSEGEEPFDKLPNSKPRPD